MSTFKFKKAVQALNLLAALEGGRINKMKALKLIWLSDRGHLRKYARPITGDQYYAMKNGPVASTTKDLAEGSSFLEDFESDYRNQYLRNDDLINFSSIKTPEVSVFSETDLIVLNQVYLDFKHLDQFDLSNLSHEYPEWKKYAPLLRNGHSRCAISLEDFIDDADELTKEIFRENSNAEKLTK